MTKVYCISGMGCDHRAFKRLSVDGYEFVPLPWVAYDDRDTLESYAGKMAVNIKESNPIILGLSFGGMLAVEIGKLIEVRHIILISSAKTKDELPEPGWLARYIVKKRVIPSFCFSIPNRLLMGLRGIVPLTERMNKYSAINGRFMQWALKVVMDWQNTTYPENISHIHGTLDIVIPGRNVKATHRVKAGQHLMVFINAKQVNGILSGILKEIQ